VDALAQFEKEEQAIGDAAAEVAYAAQRMSAKAKADLAAADAATHEHVTDVVPKKRRRRYVRKASAPKPAPVSADTAAES
jgi:hypothetical protein